LLEFGLAAAAASPILEVCSMSGEREVFRSAKIPVGDHGVEDPIRRGRVRVML
jgi:hypothetical protein